MEESKISDPLIWRETEAKCILIGKVLANKTYTRAAMESILKKAWNLPEGFDVIEINGNAFMFNFVEEEEFNRVLRGRPWTINGLLLNLMEKSKYKTCEEYDFSRGPVWIQMHNVPMEAMCLENAVTIGGYVGEVMLAENPVHNGKYVRSYMRARVLLDLKKPLAYGFWMDRPDGGKAWIPIRYEKLLNYCYNCGKIGHDNRNCKSERLLSVFDSSEPRYGAWLTTTMSRSRDDITEIIQSDWSESKYIQKKKEEALRRKSVEDVHKATACSKSQDEELFVIRLNKNLKEIRGLPQSRDKDATDANLWKTDATKTLGGQTSNTSHDDSSVKVEEIKKMPPGSEEVLKGRTVMFPGDKGKGTGTKVSNTSHVVQPEVKEGPMAMVLYNGDILCDVINRIGDLGLKRAADEEWNVSAPKRKRIGKAGPDTKPAISMYAESLRKSRVKTRRNTKRKSKELKELITDENMEEEMMGPSPIADTGETVGFVFRAGENRRRKCVAEGIGGWPLSATKSP